MRFIAYTVLVVGLMAGMMLTGSAEAGNVTVTEGEKATFQITVTPTRDMPDNYYGRIRVYYSAYGGTATKGQGDYGVGVDGADYTWTNPWVKYADGWVGKPLTVSVQTYKDDVVEGDETFKIKVDGIKVPYKGWWHHTSWSDWDIKGLPTITIKDATPAPTPAPINWGLSFCYWSSC